jgi:Zn-dependent protease with chaperone function/ssDNA-binding Zn-finger/Zn-ribbon topoisomerase 1
VFCTGCGSALPADARFCPRCGKAAGATSPASACLSCRAPLPARQSRCPSCGAEHQFCPHCGSLVLAKTVSCPSCRGLVKAAAETLLQPSEYEHPSMQSVNQAMRKSPILNAVAEKVSRKVGKPWYESTFTSIPVTERQFPRVHDVALIAARRLGMHKMPAVYVESSRGYASATYGSKQDAFVNVGSFLPRLLRDRELLFVVGHEYGHLIGHHALWTTVSNFMFGEHRSSLMADGVLGLLNPVRLVSAGVEALITNWMRIADFTADRVGLLAVGDFEVARRALFLLYQKSRADLGEVDLDEWMRQQEASDPQITKVSQLMSSGAPYLGVRLNELKRFCESPQYRAARDKVEAASGVKLDQLFDEEGFLRRLGKPGAPRATPPRTASPQQTGAPSAGVLRGNCPKCGRRLRIRLQKLPTGEQANVTCPVCKQVFSLPVARILKRQPRGAPAATESAKRPNVRVVKVACPKCRKAFAISLDKLPGKPYVDVQCSACQHKYRLSLAEVRQGSPGPA